MMNNLMPNDVGEKSITTEIKNKSIKNGCKSIGRKRKCHTEKFIETLKIRNQKKRKNIFPIGFKFNNLTVIGNGYTHNRNNSIKKDFVYDCKCDCGKVVIVNSNSIKTRKSKSCGCLQHKIIYDLKNRRFGKLLVLNRILPNLKNGRRIYYSCICKCGNNTQVKAYDLLHGKTKSCGCGRVFNKRYKGFVGNIPIVLFNRIKKDAFRKNRSFNLTLNYLDELFVKQNYICCLSGIEITMGNGTKGKGRTASLDRIDSSKGYEIDNVQWVHKDVNIMKLSHDIKYFVDLCQKISEYSKLTSK